MPWLAVLLPAISAGTDQLTTWFCAQLCKHIALQKESGRPWSHRMPLVFHCETEKLAVCVFWHTLFGFGNYLFWGNGHRKAAAASVHTCTTCFFLMILLHNMSDSFLKRNITQRTNAVHLLLLQVHSSCCVLLGEHCYSSATDKLIWTMKSVQILFSSINCLLLPNLPVMISLCSHLASKSFHT